MREMRWDEMRDVIARVGTTMDVSVSGLFYFCGKVAFLRWMMIFFPLWGGQNPTTFAFAFHRRSAACPSPSLLFNSLLVLSPPSCLASLCFHSANLSYFSHYISFTSPPLYPSLSVSNKFIFHYLTDINTTQKKYLYFIKSHYNYFLLYLLLI